MTTYFFLTIIPLILTISFDFMLGKSLVMSRGFWKVVGIFMICMLIFDSFLTALPIVLYNHSYILGVIVGTIPIEDFIYGFTLVLLVLSLPSYLRISKKDIKALFLSSRPFSWVNTAYPAGIAIYLGKGYLEWSDFLCILFFLIPYNLLVYGVNDVYDYETDIKNPRKASIEGAILPKKLHRLMLWVSMGSALIFLPLFIKNTTLFLSFITALFLAVEYSVPPLRTKTKPGLDSITSSLHFVLPAVIGFIWSGAEGLLRVEFFSFFFWGIASHMLGALPDISPDKKAGMKTIATVLGETRTAIGSFFFYALASFILLTQGKIYFLIGSCIGMYTLFPLWALLDRKTIPGLFRKFMYGNLITGFIITVTVLVVSL